LKFKFAVSAGDFVSLTQQNYSKGYR